MVAIVAVVSVVCVIAVVAVESVVAELWRSKRARGAPWVSKSSHPRKFVNHVSVHRLHARPSALQGNQWSILHFLASLGAQED